jgi:glycosyltransferase involved in cell wall biosynthesis
MTDSLTPLVSIIMPAYNAEQHIYEAISSILAQTHTHFELLICDDGSTDKTLAIIKSLSLQDDRIHVFNNSKNIGNLKTTNFLFSQCKGKYIAIQDADDVCSKNKLQLQVFELEADPCVGLIGTNYMLTDEELTPISCGLLPLSDEEIKKKMEKEVPPLLYGSIMVRRKLVDIIGGFNIIFDRKGYADLDWLSRLSEITKVKNINEITYFYRQHGNPNKYIKDLVGRHGWELIVEAHHQRISRKRDFLAKNDIFAIRLFLGKRYEKFGNNAIWSGDTTRAKSLYIESLKIYPFNLYAIKILFKLILFKRP